jgi:uncharacterized membrane protein YqaE (UPF0057 family)
VKKCASCTKELPDAALHCVFCGAKQAAAPAVQSSVAKTAFGYSANEVMQQLGNAATQVAPSQQQAPYPQAPSQPQYQQPPQQQAPRPNSPSQGYPGGGLAPSAGAHAPTMMVQGPVPGYQPPQQQGGFAGGYQPPQQAPRPHSPSQPGYGQQPGMGIHSPQVATPQPLPAVTPPYLASQTAARAGRPIEPWKDSLRLWMFIFGGIALAVFAIPLMTDPMVFNWDAIIHAPGKEKLPPLIWATTGLLGIVCAAAPMQPLPRGLIAGVLGLAGALVPMLLMGHFGDQWQIVLMAIGAVLLVPGLLVRHAYTESLTARLMITFGVIFALLPYLVPEHGQIPLVAIFKALIEGQNHMEMILPAIANIVIVVLCLLAWMPGPATAGAKVFAWILILFPLAATALKLAGMSHMTDIITKQPGMVLSFVPGIVYAVFLGYGVATVIGKQLE